MDKIGRMALLFDFYGQLLTEKQQEIMVLYYEQNLSLGEIAEEMRVTRQAIHDIIRRCEKLLENYEQKLGLLVRYLQERSKLSKAFELLQEYKKNGKTEALEGVSQLISEIMETDQNE